MSLAHQFIPQKVSYLIQFSQIFQRLFLKIDKYIHSQMSSDILFTFSTHTVTHRNVWMHAFTLKRVMWLMDDLYIE